MKCLSACFIAATGVLTIAAMLGVVRVDVDFGILFDGRAAATAALEHSDPQERSLRALTGINSTAGGGVTLSQSVAEKFRVLETGEEAASGWVAVSLASVQPRRPLRMRMGTMTITRVAETTEVTRTAKNTELSANYIFSRNMQSPHQVNEPSLDDRAQGSGPVRYRF